MVMCTSVSLSKKWGTGHSSDRGLEGPVQGRHCRVLISPTSSGTRAEGGLWTPPGKPVDTRTTFTHTHAMLLKAVVHCTDSDTEAGQHLGLHNSPRAVMVKQRAGLSHQKPGNGSRHEDRWETKISGSPGAGAPQPACSLDILKLGV